MIISNLLQETVSGKVFTGLNDLVGTEITGTIRAIYGDHNDLYFLVEARDGNLCPIRAKACKVMKQEKAVLQETKG